MPRTWSNKSIGLLPPTMQADYAISVDNPISGTMYDLYDASAVALAAAHNTQNMRLIAASVKCTWTVQPTPLQMHMLIDGQTFVFSVINPVSNTVYIPQFDGSNAPAGQYLSTTDWNYYRPFFVEGKGIRITAETTGGTVSNLAARVVYGVFNP